MEKLENFTKRFGKKIHEIKNRRTSSKLKILKHLKFSQVHRLVVNKFERQVLRIFKHSLTHQNTVPIPSSRSATLTRRILQSQDTCFNTFRRSSVTNWKPLIETKVIKFRHLVWQNRLGVTRVSFLDQTLNISIVCPSVSNTVCIHIHSCTAMYTWLQSCDSIDMIWYDSWPQIVTLSRENGVIQIL